MVERGKVLRGYKKVSVAFGTNCKDSPDIIENFKKNFLHSSIAFQIIKFIRILTIPSI